MGRATVVAQIAIIDAISLRRELTVQESWRLQKMLSTLRRYDGNRVAMCGRCGRRAEDPSVIDCTSGQCGLADRHELDEVAA